MKNIKAVLFDLDGTLINTLADLADATNYALGRFGFAHRETEKFKYYAGEGIPKMLERALPENSKSTETVEKLKPVFFEYYNVHYADKTSEYEGMTELLITLRERGFQIAVVTNKAEPIAKIILDSLYPNQFDLIFGQRDGVPSKPDPTLALMAMEQLGVSPQECIFVGDSGIDVKTAVNSGAYPVGVLWGFRERQELLENGARSIIKRPGELLTIIDA